VRTKQKGFTMVELLVVIAIIGILASIALISYNNVQNKAKDKAAIGEMTQLRTQAQVFYDDTANVYTGFCADAETTRIAGSIADHGGTAFNCDAGTDEWAAEVTLAGGTIYCVDSSGTSKTIAATKGADTTVCE
jgi:prepilin-type N-terminal cleavage/methylation domain-containing protein